MTLQRPNDIELAVALARAWRAADAVLRQQLEQVIREHVERMPDFIAALQEAMTLLAQHQPTAHEVEYRVTYATRTTQTTFATRHSSASTE